MNVNELLLDALRQPLPPVAPSTVLADIPGWDSIVMVRLMVAVEEALGRELTESEIEAVTTVSDIERLVGRG